MGSIVGLKLLTQLLPKEIYGRVNLLEVAMVLPGWLFFAPIMQAAIRLYAPSRESKNLGPLFRTILTLYFWVSLLVAAVGLTLIHTGLFKGTNFTPLALTLTLAILLANTWQLLGTGISGAARLRRRAAGLSVFTTWSRPLCAGAFILLFAPSLGAVLTGYLVASLAMLAPSLKPVRIAFHERNTPWVQKEILAKLLAYGAPYAIWSAFAWGENYVDRYILQFLLGAATVGPYVAAFQVASMPFGFGAAFFLQLATPIVFERAGAGTEPMRLASGRAVVQSSVGLFAGLGILMIIGYALGGVWIMRLLTRADYVVSSGILTVLAVSAFAQSLALLLGTSVLAHNRPDVLLWAYLIPGTLSVPLSFLWIRQAGMLGAACANAATSFLFLALVWWILRVVVDRPHAPAPR